MGLSDNPLVYDAIQAFAGRHVSDRRLRRAIASAGDQTVLDIGAGTGSLAGLLPAGVTYWALDNDPAKLRRLSNKVPDAHCLLRSALDTGLSDRAVEWTVCAAVAHHLDDDELSRLVSELARVTRYRLVFLDALSTSKYSVARLLWRYDRGSHPRSAGALLSALGSYFEVERVEYFRMFHKYLLCSCRPAGDIRGCAEDTPHSVRRPTGP